MNLRVIIVGLYLIGMLAIGFLVKDKSKSMEDYFAGGRSFSLWFNVNTMAATAIGAGTTMGIAGMAYGTGVAAGWILVGFSIGFSLIAFLISNKMYRLNAITMPDVIESRFGKNARGLSAVLVTLQYIGIEAAQILALGILTQKLFDVPFMAAIIITGGVMILYTVMGGLFAVALTDVVQMILNAIGVMIILPFVGLKAVGGLNGLTTALAPSYFDPMAFGFAATLGFLSWIIPQGFLSQELWIRVFASKSEKVAKKATLIASIGIYIPYMISVLVIGLVGAVLFPNISGDSIIPHMVNELTSPLVQGIIYASLIAAVMSCADSVLLVASSNIVKDFYLTYISKDKEKTPYKTIIKVSRISVVLLGIASIVLAANASGIIALMENIATPFCGALFPVIIALFYWKKATPQGATATMIVSIIASIILLVTKVDIFGLHPIFINVVVCTLTLIIVSLATYKDGVDTKSSKTLIS